MEAPKIMQPGTPPEGSSIGRLVAGVNLIDVGLYGMPATYYECDDDEAMQMFYGLSSSSSFSPNWESSSGITDTPEARRVAASTYHKEAEKRRRQRINSHLDQLRSLIPCNSKTDKASLLAKVVQRLNELEQQTSEITRLETTPSESDEVNVVVLSTATNDNFSRGDGSKTATFIKASLCCEDRSDLIPDIIETLRSLRLRTLRAEVATLRGRIRNVLIVTGDGEEGDQDARPVDTSVHFLRNALRSLVDRSSSTTDAAGVGNHKHRLKRHRF